MARSRAPESESSSDESDVWADNVVEELGQGHRRYRAPESSSDDSDSDEVADRQVHWDEQQTNSHREEPHAADLWNAPINYPRQVNAHSPTNNLDPGGHEEHGNVVELDDQAQDGDVPMVEDYEEPPPEEQQEQAQEEGAQSPTRATEGHEREERIEEALNRLRGEILAIKFTTNMSDGGIEKLYKCFCDNMKTFARLLDAGMLTNSYRRSIKTVHDSSLPKVTCKVVAEETTNGHKEIKTLDNLRAIPKKFLRPKKGTKVRMLTSEATTTLAEIKRHYIWAHPHLDFRQESVRRRFKECKLSLDGVREAKSSPKHLHIVTIMIGDDIYIWKVMNPLKGDANAKPSVGTMLG